MSAPGDLCLVDASIYLYRGWQTLPSTTLDAEGRAAGAVVGFADTLIELLARLRPESVLCAFDTCGRQGDRNAIHPPYKSSRPPKPPALADQIGRCMDIARALGTTALGSERVEADDIVGHFAVLARRAGRAVTVVSGDKDLAQHISADDIYWDVGRHAPQDARALERRFGVRPAQIPDWLALCGDASDDIPGVPGVGAATAARLIRKWGSLEVLFANLDRVARMRFRGAPGVALLLREHAGGVRLARRLTGRLDDPALPNSLEALARRAVRESDAREILLAAGFAPRRAAERAAQLSVSLPDGEAPGREAPTAAATIPLGR